MDINQKFNVYDDGIGICECSHHPAHYTIPSFRRYCISETGEIFSHIGETRPLKWYYQESAGNNVYEYKICAIRKYGLSEVTDACENIQP